MTRSTVSGSRLSPPPSLVTVTLEDGVVVALEAADRGVARHVRARRYELNELDFVRRTVRQGMHAVDGGAHAGVFALTMAARVGPSGSVHAFEPVPSSIACLVAGIRANDCESRVVVHRAALGAAAGVAHVVYSPVNPGAAFVQMARAAPPEWVTLRTRVESLDSCNLPRPVSFIKLDIEGSEPLAIDGAAGLLREDRPVVLTELDGYALGRRAGLTPGDVIDRMHALGYVCHLLGAGVAGERITDAGTNATTPVVFLPR